MPQPSDIANLRTAIRWYRSVRKLGDDWKITVSDDSLEIAVTSPDGIRSRSILWASRAIESQAIEFLDAEYESWEIRVKRT